MYRGLARKPSMYVVYTMGYIYIYNPYISHNIPGSHLTSFNIGRHHWSHPPGIDLNVFLSGLPLPGGPWSHRSICKSRKKMPCWLDASDVLSSTVILRFYRVIVVNKAHIDLLCLLHVATCEFTSFDIKHRRVNRTDYNYHLRGASPVNGVLRSLISSVD